MGNFRIKGKRLWLLFALLYAIPWLGAQSKLNFPRLSFEKNGLTGVAIVNPNSIEAVVTVTAYGVNGGVLQGEGFVNPVQLSIPGKAQFAALLSSPKLFGARLDPSLVGWFEASSSVENLTGFFLILDDQLSFLDGADLPESSSQLVFNQIQVGQAVSTELNLINPSDVQANPQIRLYNRGELLKTVQLAIPAKGVFRSDAGTLFEILSLSENSYLEVFSDVEVAGFEVVRPSEGDVQGLNARAAQDQSQRLYFAQVAVLSIWQTRVGLLNYSDEPVIVTLLVHKPNGDLYGPEDLANNPVTRTLDPKESLEEDIGVLFGFRGNQLRQGWLEVRSISRAINGYLTYGIPETGSIATVAAESQARKQALFAHLATSSGLFTGVALVNPGTLAANVRIMAFRSDGTSLGIHETVLRPGERSSRLIDTMIPNATGQNRGFIWVQSDIPIYMTSLFGNTEGILANIPPQPSPETFQPDQGLSPLTIDPHHYLLPAGESKQFSVAGTQAPVSWAVNDQPGGNPQIGLVNPDGLYQAPALVPLPLPIIVTAEREDRLAGASVDVLQITDLIQGLGILQSVAYLNSLQRVYIAEFSILANTSFPANASSGSDVSEVVGGVRIPIKNFPGEEISDMIPFEPSEEISALLVALKDSGRIVQLDPETEIVVEIATGLNQPTALVIDPVTGDLLVAEQDQISSIPDSVLLSETATAANPQGFISPPPIALRGANGLAIDECSGDVFFSDQALGALFRLDRTSGDLLEIEGGPNQPGQLLGLYRTGLPCPDSFHLFITEQNQLTLVIPATLELSPVFEAPGIIDIAYLSEESSFANVAGIFTAEMVGDEGQIRQIELPGLYTARSINPRSLPPCLGTLSFPDRNLETAVREALFLSPTQLLTCSLAEEVVSLDASARGIQNLTGLELLRNLQTLNLERNLISDIQPLAGLIQLRSLNLGLNFISDPVPLQGLVQLEQLNLAENSIGDTKALEGLTRLTNLDLKSNSISDISPLKGLIQLVDLNLNDNAIPDILWLAGMSQLTKLDLGSNSLTSVNPLAGLVNLESLKLSRNSIRTISSLANLTELTSLLLDFNQINSLASLVRMTRLKKLDVSDNRVTSTVRLADLRNLDYLDLGRNLITDINPLANLTQLEMLFLETNSISDITALVENSGIGSGDTVDLRFNPLDGQDCINIRILTSRGVSLLHSVDCFF